MHQYKMLSIQYFMWNPPKKMYAFTFQAVWGGGGLKYFGITLTYVSVNRRKSWFPPPPIQVLILLFSLDQTQHLCNQLLNVFTIMYYVGRLT